MVGKIFILNSLDRPRPMSSLYGLSNAQVELATRLSVWSFGSLSFDPLPLVWRSIIGANVRSISDDFHRIHWLPLLVARPSVRSVRFASDEPDSPFKFHSFMSLMLIYYLQFVHDLHFAQTMGLRTHLKFSIKFILIILWAWKLIKSMSWSTSEL